MIVEAVLGLVSFFMIFAAIQIVRMGFTDRDLTLQWVEKFGKSPAALSNKVVWITGASSGIGEALAYNLAKVKCRLILSARREEHLEKVKKKCQELGQLKSEDVLVLPLDLLKFDTHAGAVEMALKHFKKVDILVNNAGRTQRALWEETSLEVDRQMMELNVLGPLSLSKAILPHFLDQREGQFVIVSSLLGKMGAPGCGSYSGSKHALHGWFDTLRVEAYDKNIDVTLACPGPVFSEALLSAFTAAPNENFGRDFDSKDHRMTAERCAQLIAVATANKLNEAWISVQPMLFFTYMAQYLPSIHKIIASRMGSKLKKQMMNTSAKKEK